MWKKWELSVLSLQFLYKSETTLKLQVFFKEVSECHVDSTCLGRWVRIKECHYKPHNQLCIQSHHSLPPSLTLVTSAPFWTQNVAVAYMRGWGEHVLAEPGSSTAKKVFGIVSHHRGRESSLCQMGSLIIGREVSDTVRPETVQSSLKMQHSPDIKSKLWRNGR